MSILSVTLFLLEIYRWRQRDKAIYTYNKRYVINLLSPPLGPFKQLIILDITHVFIFLEM